MKYIYFPEQQTYQGKYVYEKDSIYALQEGKEMFASRWLTRGCIQLSEEEVKGKEVKADPRKPEEKAKEKVEKKTEVKAEKKPEEKVEKKAETKAKKTKKASTKAIEVEE